MKEIELLPPLSLRFVGDGDFLAIGEAFGKMFVEQGGLKPHERVLDIGCGVGRMAIPLTNYLISPGQYAGFDIVKEGIDWCQQNITPRFANFEFQFLDVYNGHYNPAGKLAANSVRFPYESDRFDFVFLTSVFTHMLADGIERYLCEVQRVLNRAAGVS